MFTLKLRVKNGVIFFRRRFTPNFAGGIGVIISVKSRTKKGGFRFSKLVRNLRGSKGGILTENRGSKNGRNFVTAKSSESLQGVQHTQYQSKGAIKRGCGFSSK